MVVGGGGLEIYFLKMPAAPFSKKKVLLDKLYIMRHFSTGKNIIIIIIIIIIITIIIIRRIISALSISGEKTCID